jgi:CheY-like chemotaxis protein
MERNETYKSVLIIEDDDDVREALATLLEDEGYGVHAAHNGREGLQLASGKSPPRVIVLDLMMPIMNGWEFLAARRNNPKLAGVPVVVVSATGDPARLGEVTAFLRKPIDIQRLLEVVHEYAAP